MIVTQHSTAPPTLRGRAPAFVSRLLATSPGPMRTLGAFPTARYLQAASGEVLALLSAEAVPLPLGILLDRPASRLELDAPEMSCTIRGGRLYCDGSAVLITGARDTWLRLAGEPRTEHVARCRRRLSPTDPGRLDALTSPDPADGVARVLGRGPGLTPAGDDVLCGLLAGARLFGRGADAVIGAVRRNLATRPRATTALSRQLLLAACAGHGLPQLQRLADELCSGGSAEVQSALAATTAIGHSSGDALAAGLLASIDLPRAAVADTTRRLRPSAVARPVTPTDAEPELAGSRS